MDSVLLHTEPVELAYDVFGEEHLGCPIIILHGFFASSRNWRLIAKKLAIHWRVYVLDMRNHGQSPHALNMDYPSMAADLILFMQTQQILEAHIVGHSMGGKVAMYLALTAPERINSLVIVDISPTAYQHNFDNLINALKSLPLAELSNRKQAETWLQSSIPDLNYRQFLLQNLSLQNGEYYWRIDLEIFHANAHHIVGFPVINDNFYYLKPVLFMSGENSSYICSKSIYQYFPNAKIIVLNGTGHWMHVDAPELFLEMLEAWLKV